MKIFKQEKFLELVLKLTAYLSLIISIAIVLNLILGAIPFFASYSMIDFLTGNTWSPNSNIFGVLPLLLGTLKVVILSAGIAIPLGLMSAIYLSQYANTKIKNILKPILELLAGIPTIIYGFFAYNFINPLILQGNGSYSTLGAAIALGIMLTPIIASLSEDTLSAIPKNLTEASIGLGATKFETITKILIPAGLSGIIASFVLAISRAFGETMIVSLAAGQVANLSLNPLHQSMTITGAIIQSSTTDASLASPEYTVLYALGILLFIITLTLNIISKWIIKKYKVTYN
ncbi:MAG: phosphate ABC transporter permease subunit PstC [Mycoplasmatales bacterium]